MDRNKRDMDNIGEYIFIHRAIWIEIGEIWKDILNLFYPQDYMDRNRRIWKDIFNLFLSIGLYG